MSLSDTAQTQELLMLSDSKGSSADDLEEILQSGGSIADPSTASTHIVFTTQNLDDFVLGSKVKRAFADALIWSGEHATIATAMVESRSSFDRVKDDPLKLGKYMEYVNQKRQASPDRSFKRQRTTDPLAEAKRPARAASQEDFRMPDSTVDRSPEEEHFDRSNMPRLGMDPKAFQEAEARADRTAQLANDQKNHEAMKSIPGHAREALTNLMSSVPMLKLIKGWVAVTVETPTTSLQDLPCLPSSKSTLFKSSGKRTLPSSICCLEAPMVSSPTASATRRWILWASASAKTRCARSRSSAKITFVKTLHPRLEQLARTAHSSATRLHSAEEEEEEVLEAKEDAKEAALPTTPTTTALGRRIAIFIAHAAATPATPLRVAGVALL
jgi:hypothetical protein